MTTFRGKCNRLTFEVPEVIYKTVKKISIASGMSMKRFVLFCICDQLRMLEYIPKEDQIEKVIGVEINGHWKEMLIKDVEQCFDKVFVKE